MNTFEDKLIENVKKYPILYRSKQKNYKNIMCKDSCWAEIATVLKMSREYQISVYSVKYVVFFRCLFSYYVGYPANTNF